MKPAKAITLVCAALAAALGATGQSEQIGLMAGTLGLAALCAAVVWWKESTK